MPRPISAPTVLAVLLFAAHAFATAQAARPKPAQALVVAAHPFDTAATVVRASDLSNIRQVIARFDVGPKGEFETSKEYAERAKAAASPGEYFAVSMGSASDVCRPSFRYDADNEAMAFFVAAHTIPHEYAGRFASVRAACPARAGEKYVASNAYGAKVTVTTLYDSTFEVNAINARMDVVNNVRFAMPPAVARQVKQDLQVAIILRTAADTSGNVVLHGTDYFKPTRDTPAEMFTDRLIINADDVRFWVYNVRTGEVYARIDAKILKSRL